MLSQSLLITCCARPQLSDQHGKAKPKPERHKSSPNISQHSPRIVEVAAVQDKQVCLLCPVCRLLQSNNFCIVIICCSASRRNASRTTHGGLITFYSSAVYVLQTPMVPKDSTGAQQSTSHQQCCSGWSTVFSAASNSFVLYCCYRSLGLLDHYSCVVSCCGHQLRRFVFCVECPHPCVSSTRRTWSSLSQLLRKQFPLSRVHFCVNSLQPEITE